MKLICAGLQWRHTFCLFGQALLLVGCVSYDVCVPDKRLPLEKQSREDDESIDIQPLYDEYRMLNKNTRIAGKCPPKDGKCPRGFVLSTSDRPSTIDECETEVVTIYY